MNAEILAAAYAGKLAEIDSLLSRGASVNCEVRSPTQVSPVKDILGDRDLSQLAFFLENLESLDTASVTTPLHEAARAGHRPAVSLLLARGAKINKQNTFGDTALHEAARAGHNAVVLLLINNGAEINKQNKFNDTPLHEAAYLGHTIVVETLLRQGALVNIENARQSTPLHEAVSRGHKIIVKFLLNRNAKSNTYNKLGETPFHDACSRGDKAVVELLLEYGVLIENKNKRGMTPIQSAVLSGQEELVKLLLEQGAMVNTFNEEGESALYLSVLKGEKKIIQLLLQYGAYSYQDEKLDQMLSMYWKDCNNYTEEDFPFYTSLLFAGVRIAGDQQLPIALQQIKQLIETRITDWLSPLMLPKEVCQAITPQLLKVFPQVLESPTLYSETLKEEIEEKKNRLLQEMKNQEFSDELRALIEKDFIIHNLATNIMEYYLLPGRVAQFLVGNIINNREQCVSFYKELFQSNFQITEEASTINATKYKPTFI